MILTITMNPSLDFIYFTDHFAVGKHNRFDQPVRFVGGKGINCGRTAAIAGSNVLLMGFLGGGLGNVVQEMLTKEQRYTLHFLPVTEETRTAITIMHDQNTHTEMVDVGPHVPTSRIEALLTELKKICHTQDISIITINGSVNNKNPMLYGEMMRVIREEISPTIPVLMDISGAPLESILLEAAYKPTFLKPNLHEFAALFDVPIKDKADVVEQLKAPLFAPIELLMVSCGSQGAIVKVHDQCWDISLPNISIVNTTGSGDATVGGFAYSLEQGASLEEAVKFAMACGMSNAQQAEVGVIDLDDVQNFLPEIVITKIEN